MADRAKYIQLGVSNGITDLNVIREAYNKYAEGGKVKTKVGEYKVGNFIRLIGENFFRRVNSDGTLSRVSDGTNDTYDYRKGVPRKVKDNVEWSRALYSTIDPRDGYPESLIRGLSLRRKVKDKIASTNVDNMSYLRGESIGEQVADAAWRKYNGLDYDPSLLIKSGPDPRSLFRETFRLPPELENEIPTDTVALKQRIESNQKYKDQHPYDTPESVRTALNVDRETLKALRKTYREGVPVGINEMSFNSRNWGTSGDMGLSPLNVLKEYNIRYSPEDRRMYYSDTYGFDNDDRWYVNLIGGYDKYLNGTPFRIRGHIDLP